ncbi:brca1-associated ring domain protein 1 [Phtheirospermum japonicum]|uniref:Brca1-associated ring domain protein 1 n=1 Tax=Phtheirospermum japonicum TaxID=374723 RepID=A0A830CRR0_9LAMI|nr:brca1-associated ring domain protein 1 [Phtheirospermum japonicum]
MPAPDRRRDGVDEDATPLFDDEGMEMAEEDDIDHSEIPLRLRPLISAAESGDLNALRLALENFDGNIDEPMEDGDTLLHLACLYGHLTCVQFLLERGANLEAKDEDGGTPLHDACAGGYTEIAQFLINRANDPERVKRMLETVDVEGDTPLHHAARGEYSDTIKLLLARGASPTKTNIYGKSPTELADAGTEAKKILEEAVTAV